MGSFKFPCFARLQGLQNSFNQCANVLPGPQKFYQGVWRPILTYNFGLDYRNLACVLLSFRAPVPTGPGPGHHLYPSRRPYVLPPSVFSKWLRRVFIQPCILNAWPQVHGAHRAKQTRPTWLMFCKITSRHTFYTQRIPNNVFKLSRSLVDTLTTLLIFPGRW